MKHLTFLLLIIPVLVFGEATHFTDLTVDDDLIVTDDVTIGGDTAFTGDLTVTGSLIANGILDANLTSDFAGDAVFNEDVSLCIAADDKATFTLGYFTQFRVGTGSTPGITLGTDDVFIEGTLETDGVASFSAGAVGAPAIYGTDDVDTGIWWSAADTLNMSVGGAEVLEFGATANIIGNASDTTTILGALRVGTGGTPGITLGDDDLYVEGTLEVDDVMSFAAGAVGAPGLYPTDDTDTGIYAIGADQLGIAANGAVILDIATTGLNITGTLSTTGIVDIPAGAVGTPNLIITGDVDTGLYQIGADNLGISANGAKVLDIGTAGLGITGTLTTTGIVDIPVGAVGAPSLFITGSATTGFYQSAADEMAIAVGGANVGTWDGTGLVADGFNGPIGTTTPAAGTFTDVAGSGDFSYGSDPGDLHLYTRRTQTIKTIDGFDYGEDTLFALMWDITGVVGAGTNNITGTDGWNVLTTGGAGGPDMESTVSNGLHHNRAYEPRLEIVVDVGTLAGSEFNFGFYAGAAEYAEIRYDASTDGNWHIVVDDTAAPDDVDSTIAVTTDPTKLEIWTAADGTIGYAIDDVEGTVVGVTNLMTASDHYARYQGLEEGASARVFAVDYIIQEQLKVQ